MKYRLYLLLALCTFLSVSCSSPFSSSSPSATQAASAKPLRTLADQHTILIGTAVNVSALQQNADYASILGREYSSITPENVMKVKFLDPFPSFFK